jgi:hypothetical protein
LTDPNFHALEDMEVKRQLLGEIYPGFNEYDAATQDKDLSKGLKHWQEYYTAKDTAAKPKPTTFKENVVSAISGAFAPSIPPPPPVSFTPKDISKIPGYSGSMKVLDIKPNTTPPSVQNFAGMITPGNIDLTKQPSVPNKQEGGMSTVWSASFSDNGKEVLVSRVTPDGRILYPPKNPKDPDPAFEYYKKTGQHLGIFDNPDTATAYAQILHNDYQSGKIKPALLPLKPGKTSMRAATPQEAARGMATPIPYAGIREPLAVRIMSSFSQGIGTGLTYGLGEKIANVDDTKTDKAAYEVGKLVGSIPAFGFLGEVLAPVFSQARNIPVMGKWIRNLDNIRKVRTAVKAGEEAAPASAEIAGSTIESLAKNYPEFGKTLDFVLRHPKLIDHVISPVMQGTEAGTVMATASTIEAIAKGEKPKDAIIHSYSIAFLGEMMRAAPVIRALGTKFKIDLRNPNLSKVITELSKGIPRQSAEYRAFREYLNQYAAAPAEYAVGRALQSAVGYGIAAAGITAAMTDGDIRQRLAAGGESGIQTFAAVGAMHLPSVIETISTKMGRKVDAAEATIAYNNMSPQEKKELAQTIAPTDIKNAVDNINNAPGRQPAPPVERPTKTTGGPAKTPAKGKPAAPEAPAVVPPPTEAVPAPPIEAGLPPTPVGPDLTIDALDNAIKELDAQLEQASGESDPTRYIELSEKLSDAKKQLDAKLTPPPSVAPAMTPETAPPSTKTYDEVQKEIDAAEDALAAKYGEDAVMQAPIYPSAFPELSKEIGVIPDEELDVLRSLYAERDKIDKDEVDRNVDEISEKFKSLIPDPATRTSFVRNLAQADVMAALREENLPENEKDAARGVGRIANEITHYLSENMGDIPETAFHVGAQIGGSPDNPQVQLVISSEEGLGPSQEVLNEAQRWMDHLYEGQNVPKIPGARVPKEIQETFPEKPETILSQLDAIDSDTRKVVFVPETTMDAWGQSDALNNFNIRSGMTGAERVEIAGKGTYFYRPDRISQDDISRAVEEGTDHELMGIVEPKSDKATIGVRAEKWNPETNKWEEFATAVVSPENLQSQINSFKTQTESLPDTFRFLTGKAEDIAAGTMEKRGGELPEGLESPPTPEIIEPGIPPVPEKMEKPEPPSSLEAPPEDILSKLPDMDLGPVETPVVRAQYNDAVKFGVANQIVNELLDGRPVSEIAQSISKDMAGMKPTRIRMIVRAVADLKGIPSDPTKIDAFIAKSGISKVKRELAPPPQESKPQKQEEIIITGPQSIRESAPIGKPPARIKSSKLDEIRKNLKKKSQEAGFETAEEIEPGGKQAGPDVKGMLADPEVFGMLVDLGDKYYNSGITDRSEWHASIYDEAEDIAEGLGDVLEPLFKKIWSAITGEEDYVGGTGGVYAAFDRVGADLSGGEASKGDREQGEGIIPEGGGKTGGIEPTERPDTRSSLGLPPEQGIGGAAKESDIEAESRKGARFSPRGRKSVVLTKTQRREINAKVAELVEKKQPGDPLTEEETELLRRYTGSGGLGSTEQERGVLYEHYTSYRICAWKWDKLRSMGFPMDNLKVMDPAFGIGNIPGFAPADAKLFGTEIDPTAVRVARLLYPDADIRELPFEQFMPRRDLDVMASNVPFNAARGASRYAEEAKEYEDIKALHDFFFVKSLDMTRPNGVVMFITSTGTMDGVSKGKVDVRKRINRKAEFLGAYRTPAGEYHANTQYDGSTDIIFLRKRTPEEIENWKEDDYQDDFINSLYGDENPIGGHLSQWYVKHPEKAWGELKPGHGVRAGQETRVGVVMDKERYAEMLENALLDDVRYEAKETTAKIEEDEELQIRDVLGETPQGMVPGTIVWMDELGKWGFAQSGTGVILEATELPKISTKKTKKEDSPYHRVREGLKLVELADDLFKSLRNNDVDTADSLRAQIKPLLAAYQKKWATDKQNPTGSPASDPNLWKYLNGGPAASPYPFADPRVWKLAALTESDGSLSKIFSENNLYLPPPEPREFDATDLVDTAKFIYEYTGDMDWAEVAARYNGEGLIGPDQMTPDVINKMASRLVGNPDFSIEALDGSSAPIMQINDEYLFGDIHPKIDQTVQMLDQVRGDHPEGPEKDRIIAALKNQLAKLSEVLPPQADSAEVVRRSDPFSAYIEDRIVIDFLHSYAPWIDKVSKELDPIKGRYFWELKSSYGGQQETKVMEDEQYKDDLGIERTRSVEKVKSFSTEFIQDYLNHNRPQKEVPTGRTDSRGRPTMKKIYDQTGEKIYTAISEQFRKWGNENLNKFESITPKYNRAYRSFRERFYSPKQLDIPGLSAVFKGKLLTINPHQWQGVGRMTHQGSGIISYAVGGGKTLTAILLAAHLKNRNKVKKPLIIVPSKVVKNWAYEISQALPDAKIVDMSGMDANNRYKMLQRLAVSDADFVLATFEGMKEIPLRKSEEYIQEDIKKLEDRLRAAQEASAKQSDKRAKKHEQDIQNALLRLEEKLTKLQQMKKTKTMYFEDLGVDAIMIDEGHNYKNASRDYADMAEYVREAKSAQRADDMIYKTRYIHERRGGRKGQNVWMMTATPTPNHPAEIYVMMQYVAPDEWTNRGINNAGDFIEQFGRMETREVKGALGVPTSKTVWAGYKNLTELRNIFRRYIDFRTIEMLGIKRPDAEYIDIKLPPTGPITEAAGYIAWLEDYLKSDPIAAQMDGINHLSILTRARKLAADAAIYDAEEFKDKVGEPGTKIAEVVRLMIDNDTGENTQLVFLDLYRGGITEEDDPDSGKAATGDNDDDLQQEQKNEHFVELVNLHQVIKDRLVESGIPEDQIAIVNGQVNSGAKAKFKLQQLNAEGKIRFLIGSRAAMGEGMNLQTSTNAIYHIDVPYNFAAMEQADGRGLRQGNKNDSVKIYRFLVGGTSDAKMYDLIARKYQWGLELWTGEADEVLDFDQDGRNFEELSDSAGINTDTLDYFRAKHAITSVVKAKQEITAIVERKHSHLKNVLDDVQWREKSINDIEQAFARGEASDSLRRRYQGHKDNIQKTYAERDELQEEITKLMERLDTLNSEFKKATDFVTLYEDAKRLDKTIEELARERGIGEEQLGDRAFVSGLDIKPRKAKVRPKKEEGLPTPPEDMETTPGEQPETASDYEVPSITTRSGWGTDIAEAKVGKKMYASAREEEKGPNHIATIETKTISPRLSQGRIPQEIIDEVESKAGIILDPITAVVKPVTQGWTIDDQSHQFRIISYGDGTSDVTEEDMWGRIEIPELMNIVHELTGKPIMLNKRLSSSLGRFTGIDEGKIEIRPDLFKAENREQLARTMAHEIGHLADWLPDKTLNRGNLLGRLLTLRRMRKKHWDKVIPAAKEFKDELIALSEYWKPYDPKKETEGYIKYRRSPRELYADFVSVMLNSPGTARRLAPKFTREFHAYLDRKPEFKDAYVKLRMMMSGNTPEDYLDNRINLVGGMIQKAEAISRNIEQEVHELHRAFWGSIKDYVFDMRWETEQRVNRAQKAGCLIPETKNPKYLWDELNFKSYNNRWLFMDKLQKDVFEKYLLPAKITAQDIGYDKFESLVVESPSGKTSIIKNNEPFSPYMALGIYMFLHRSSTQRANVANPKIAGGAYATETLDRLRERMGDVKFKALEDTAHAYTDAYWPLVEKAFEVGIYPERAKESFEENKYNYVKFVSAEHISKYVSPMVRAQIGFAGDVENPIISDIKMRLALIDLITIQEAKRATIDFFRSYEHGAVSKAEPIVTTDVIPTWRAEPDKKVVEILENGKTVGYQMDPYIADSINQRGPTPIANGFKWLNHFHEVWWKIVILYNLGFGGWGNPNRDFWSNYKKLPLKNTVFFGDFIQLLRAYGQAYPHVRSWLAGKGDDMIKEMVSSYEWSVSVSNVVSQENDPYHHLLKRVGVITDNGDIDPRSAAKMYRGAMWILQKLSYPSQLFELMGKTAGHIVRVGAGEKGKTLAFNMRRFTSTPAWYRQGKAGRYMNRIFPFATMFLQGWVSEYQTFANPNTRGGYILRAGKIAFLKVLAALLAAGALKSFLGDELSDWFKDKYGQISDYMESNYLNVPFAETEDGKPIFFSMPLDEGSRLSTGIMSTILRGMEANDPNTWQNVVDFMTALLPSLSPIGQLGSAYYEFYLKGRNPKDGFRGRNVLPPDVAEEGRLSLEANWRMFLFSVNQLGLGQYQTFDNSDQNWYQTWTQYDPVFGKFAGRVVKIGGYGTIERERKEARIIREASKDRSREKRNIGDNTRRFANANQDVQRQSTIVADRINKGEDRKKLLERYPLAKLKGRFARTSRNLSNQERRLWSLRGDVNIPTDLKDARIKEIKEVMDGIAAGALDHYENMLSKKSESLPSPPGSGLEPPPNQ